jgi:hypothetical protein
VKNRSILQKSISTTLYLLILNPRDDDVSSSKHGVVDYNHNKLFLTLLSILFYCYVIAVWTAIIYHDHLYLLSIWRTYNEMQKKKKKKNCDYFW